MASFSFVALAKGNTVPLHGKRMLRKEIKSKLLTTSKQSNVINQLNLCFCFKCLVFDAEHGVFPCPYEYRCPKCEG